MKTQLQSHLLVGDQVRLEFVQAENIYSDHESKIVVLKESVSLSKWASFSRPELYLIKLV